jgi:hypothetical protein
MQNTIFDSNTHYSSKWYIFKNCTFLGSLHETIDWQGLEALLPSKQSPKGAPAWLPKRGYFALMMLKHYMGLSDEKLLEHFHTDWAMQLFCGVQLQDNERIRDNAFVSNVRTYLGKHLDLNQMQRLQLSYWKQYMVDKQVLLMDATCFESYIRYPTDVKLLWECVQTLYERLIPQLCKAFGLAIPRSKFDSQKQKYMRYARLRKKGYRKTKARKKALLYLLHKGISQYEQLLHQTKGGDLSQKMFQLFGTIKKVCLQQQQLFDKPKQKLSERIVSLHKPYVRPIVRGKENKPVEFGMKVHMCQVDGINWVEHDSFDNFNETKRLKYSVLKHKINIGNCTHLAADRIYPTNDNRNFVSSKHIQTNFDKKGPKSETKAEKQIKSILNTARGSRMEGAFGNEKNHYLLRKIKSHTQATERVWMFFGVLTANAVSIAKRRLESRSKEPPTQLAA